MGRTNYLLTLITNGEWMIVRDRWCYQGDKKSKALVVSENIRFDALKKRICDKIIFDSQRYDIELRYISPMKEKYQPFDVNGDDDLEAFKFLNSKTSKEGVWPVELYSSLKLKKDDGLFGEQVDSKLFDLGGPKLVQEMRVPLSAPSISQTQPGGPFSKVDMTVDEILEADMIFNEVDWKEKRMSSPNNMVLLSSDDEQSPKVAQRNKGKQVIEVLSDDEEIYDGFTTVKLGAGFDEVEGNEFVGYAEENDADCPSFDVDEEVLQGMEDHKYPTQDKSGERAIFDVEEDDEGRNMMTIREGDYYNTKKELKDALNSIALRDCCEMTIKKSDKTTFQVGCVDNNCTFSCRGSIFKKTNMFRVRKFVGEHTCGMRSRHNHHKQATTRMIAEKILPRFAGGSNGPKAKDIVEEMKTLGVNASYYKANRARLHAQEIVRGSAEQSYSRMYSWMFMLEKSNLGSHTTIERDANQRFKYAFWSLGAWIRAMPNLRKVISVDATHLSARYRGVLLLAAAQDGNKHIYPLAVCVADSENDASWTFFFKKLKVIVQDAPEVVFISDRHASIMKGLRNNYVFATQGYCIFHIYQNFKARHGRGDLLELWNMVAKAYTVQEFNRLFEQLTKESKKVSDYVIDAGVKNWSRAHFPSNRFNIMTTNNDESLNSRFKEERGWPIIPMFDQILAIVCNWFCTHMEEAARWDEVVIEKVQKKLDSRYMKSVTMTVRRLSQFEAEVKDGTSRFEVNLNSRTCDCKVFQIDQIPCTHAIAAATNRGVDIANLVHPMLKTEQFKEIYKETLHLVPPFERWVVPPSLTALKCLPPQVRRPVGRPKTNRFRAHWEKNWSNQRKCDRCGKKGHYQGKCTTHMP